MFSSQSYHNTFVGIANDNETHCDLEDLFFIIELLNNSSTDVYVIVPHS